MVFAPTCVPHINYFINDYPSDSSPTLAQGYESKLSSTLSGGALLINK